MIPRRQIPALLSLLALVGAALLVASASGSAHTATFKPVIAKPVTVPAQPAAGKRFAVSFKVTRSDTGRALLRGTMICDPSVAGTMIKHAESFRAGTARLTFVVPTTAAGNPLKVKLTIRAAGTSATRISTFRVAGVTKPALSIADASVAEGNSGTTPLSIAVKLSAASSQVVTVGFASANGTATAPSDYAPASGTLTFQPGETAKTIPIGIVGDTAIEPDETFTVTLSNAVNATIADSTATGTITNDDTQVPVTPGSYKGATQNGDLVFLTVLANRTLTGFRVNDVLEPCDGREIRLRGVFDWPGNSVTIGADGSFFAENNWAGSAPQSNVYRWSRMDGAWILMDRPDVKIEWISRKTKLTGRFSAASSSAGAFVVEDELNYTDSDGTRRYRCSSGEVGWSVTLQG